MQFEFIVTVSHLGLKGFCKQLLEQFHSGQFLISRSRFTIEDINLLLLISPNIPRAKYAYVSAYVGTILKDSLKTISTEVQWLNRLNKLHRRPVKLFRECFRILSTYSNYLTTGCWNQFLLVDCFECYVVSLCLIKTSCLKIILISYNL